MENYQLDGIVSAFILEATNINKFNRIKNIVNIIYTMNKLTNINIVFDISSLEASILDIIALDDNELYSIIDKIDLVIKKDLITYIARHGLIVDDTILYYQIEDILLALHVIYTATAEVANELLHMLSDYGDNILLISNVFSNYTTSTTTELYSIILDVRSDFISNTIKLLEDIINVDNIDATDNTRDNILYLINYDIKFGNIDIVNNYLNNNSGDINTLYNILEKYPNDINRVVLEIAAYIYINNNCENSTGACDLTDINLEAISYLHGKNEDIVILFNKVNELLSKIIKKETK